MWLVFLDEFGHDGFYRNRSDQRYNQSPIFGFGGFMVRADKALECVSRFSHLKVKYHGESYKNREIKGNVAFPSNLYKKPYKVRKNVKDKGLHFFDILRGAEAQIIYNGFEKYVDDIKEHRSGKLHLSRTRRAVAKINKFCIEDNSSFVLVFDGHQIHSQRMQMVDQMSKKGRFSKNRLANSPYDLDSDMHDCIQIADWVCSLLVKYLTYEHFSKEWKTNKIYHSAFIEDFTELSSSACEFAPRQQVLIQ